jgi:hypothetical protein
MRYVFASVVVMAAAVPALAQRATETLNVRSEADCQTNFRIADRDRDGFLDDVEVSARPKLIPTTLLQSTPIEAQEYLEACRQLVRHQLQ